jgi:hypothetical protein
MKNSQSKVHAAFAAVLVGLFVIGAVQGRRIDGITDAEAFYRWMLQAATNYRLEGTLEYIDTARVDEPLDDEFFAEVSAAAEQVLPEVEVDEEDRNDAGEAYSKLIRAVRHELDDDLWAFARSSASDELRQTFKEYQQENLLQSTTQQLDTSSLYEDSDEGRYTVGVSSLFFGFRKVAANLLWLEVDKFWHQGNMHRMVPMMRTTVALDPNFVDAYLLGAWHLAYNIPAKLEYTPEPLKEFHPKYGKRLGLQEVWFYVATDFLKDGIRNNPRDYRVYFDLGYAVYDVKLQDWPNSIRYLREAMHHRHDRWVPRRLAMSLMRNGQYEDAIAGWEQYLEKFSTNPVANYFLQVNRAYLHEAYAEEARECAGFADAAAESARVRAEDARSSGNDTLVRQLDAEAARAEQIAREMRARGEEEMLGAQGIWTDLTLANADELATARLLRIEALNLIEEDRPLEALQALYEARWKVSSIWDEANQMIIDIKQDNAGLPGFELTTSEKLAVEREKEAEQFRDPADEPQRINRLDCEFREADL